MYRGSERNRLFLARREPPFSMVRNSPNDPLPGFVQELQNSIEGKRLCMVLTAVNASLVASSVRRLPHTSQYRLRHASVNVRRSRRFSTTRVQQDFEGLFEEGLLS